MSPPAAGSGEPAVPQAGEVHGKVIDFYQQPAEGVQVTIGDTTVTSGAGGEFRIPAVGPSYDATVLVTMSGSEDLPRYVWRFEGLTRRDPTLQVESAGIIRSSKLDVRISGVDFSSLPDGDSVAMAYGGPYGMYMPSNASSDTVKDFITWHGPKLTQFTVHALRMLKLPDRIEASQFYAYDSQVLQMADEGEVSVTLDLPNTSALPRATLTGTLQRPAGTEPTVQLFLRFPDYAMIPLVFDGTVTGSFNYFVPSIPGATFTLVAYEGNDVSRIMHVDGLTTNSPPVTLTVPSGVALGTPALQATVGPEGLFQWSGDAKVFLFRAYTSRHGDKLAVLTSKHEAQLPAAPSFNIRAGDQHTWWVETHGDYASVDAAAGPQGFLDTCTYIRPNGPERGKGSFAMSATRMFTPR